MIHTAAFDPHFCGLLSLFVRKSLYFSLSERSHAASEEKLLSYKSLRSLPNALWKKILFHVIMQKHEA